MSEIRITKRTANGLYGVKEVFDASHAVEFELANGKVIRVEHFGECIRATEPVAYGSYGAKKITILPKGV